ncbi:MAG: VOC family protein [Crocinitomicaceae bacterium]
MQEIEFILYVANQSMSKHFYEQVLNLTPTIDVPGMTEFQVLENVKLGLMPNDGIAKILEDKTVHPSSGIGIPRCELYLKVKNPQDFMDRSIRLGGRLISPLQTRDWGDRVGYIADLDGHILAFAEKI